MVSSFSFVSFRLVHAAPGSTDLGPRSSWVSETLLLFVSSCKLPWNNTERVRSHVINTHGTDIAAKWLLAIARCLINRFPIAEGMHGSSRRAHAQKIHDDLYRKRSLPPKCQSLMTFIKFRNNGSQQFTRSKAMLGWPGSNSSDSINFVDKNNIIYLHRRFRWQICPSIGVGITGGRSTRMSKVKPIAPKNTENTTKSAWISAFVYHKIA